MAGLHSCVWGRQLHTLPPIERVKAFSFSTSLPNLFIQELQVHFRLNIGWYIQRVNGFRCRSFAYNGKSKETQTPELLKVAVSSVTEILRLFIPAGRGRYGLWFAVYLLPLIRFFSVMSITLTVLIASEFYLFAHHMRGMKSSNFMCSLGIHDFNYNQAQLMFLSLREIGWDFRE